MLVAGVHGQPVEVDSVWVLTRGRDQGAVELETTGVEWSTALLGAHFNPALAREGDPASWLDLSARLAGRCRLGVARSPLHGEPAEVAAAIRQREPIDRTVLMIAAMRLFGRGRPDVKRMVSAGDLDGLVEAIKEPSGAGGSDRGLRPREVRRRVRALQALATLEGPQVEQGVRVGLSDPSPEVRLAAVEAAATEG